MTHALTTVLLTNYFSSITYEDICGNKKYWKSHSHRRWPSPKFTDRRGISVWMKEGSRKLTARLLLEECQLECQGKGYSVSSPCRLDHCNEVSKLNHTIVIHADCQKEHMEVIKSPKTTSFTSTPFDERHRDLARVGALTTSTEPTSAWCARLWSCTESTSMSACW